jgi:4-amino-4-deoxy-L-arabinose transferase-like glycosyltransferase
MRWWQSERYLVILVAVFVILGVIYSVTVPLWESPDEVANFGYVAHLVRTRSLPVQQIGALDAAHHPPLYFTVAALVSSLADFDDPTGAFQLNPEFVWSKPGGADHNAASHHTAETFPYRGIALAVHLARWVSVSMGAITVVLTYAIARRIFPRSQGLALLAAAVTAFNPQFLFISGSVNLDGMAAMTCALALWQLMRALEKPFRWQGWALTGSFCGLAVLSKSSAFTVGLTAGILLLVSAARQRSWRLLWRGALALGLSFLVVSGWWFARNWVLYGDPLGWQIFLENWIVHHRNSRIKWKDVHRFFTTQFQSYWALFGWATISVPKWVYRLLQALGVLSLVGWGRWLWRRRRHSLDEPRILGLVALVIFPLLQEGFQFRSIFTFNDSWYQGRYLFPVIAALSTLLAAGLWRLTLNRTGRTVALAAGIALLFLAIAVPCWIIRPEYTTPTLAKWQVWALPHRSDVVFGERLRLLGYRVKSVESPDHRDVTMTLYWQAMQHPELDYSVFVHVINEAGELVTQSDTGLGSDRNYPSSAWWAKDIVPSQHTLVVSPDLPAGAYEIRVGVYFWADGARLPAVEKGVFTGDFTTLDESILATP